ncbi:MAG: hypothetical protein KF852_04205 [Saprospiraceae bacterium]|nr:hypothetical protein [Saprospiraceae bacterium]
MQPQLITASPLRALASRVRDKVGTNYIVEWTTLMVNLVLSTTNNQYNFDLYKVPGADHPMDNKLDRNDGFYVSHLGLVLTKQDITTTPAQYANNPEFTAPDQNFFVGVASSWPEFRSLLTVYNGKLTIQTGNAERIKELPTNNFYCSPNRPYLLNGADPDNFPEFGPNLDQRGFYELPELMGLSGQENNTAQLTLGPGNTAIIDGSVNAAGSAVTTRNVVRLKLQGFKIVNGARAVTQLF